MTPHSPGPLSFRQIHLDFHTSPEIGGIGAKFDKGTWQETLRRAAVNSVTCFSKCHHGWSYHPTRVGKTHPHLSFDLLRAQYEACKEIGIRVPVYLSAGVDNMASHEHPEWREIHPEGRYTDAAASPLKAGFHKMDFFSPYLDYLCAQIEEAAALFPDCDGIFLDIIRQSESCSVWAMEYMRGAGLDPERPEDRKLAAQEGLRRYYERTTAACRRLRPDMPLVHNSGHVQRGRRDIVALHRHLELESLPTGGWGYDHFPESATYVAQLGMPYLGMTGKFHTTWGEFGGIKHPNALRYECAAMLAFGARCSVGDQLHPDGRLDAATYDAVGAAYREVRAKEPWCEGARSVAQIGVLSSEAEHPETVRHNAPDTGATRVLLEEHHLFHLIDRESDFGQYELLVLPDDIVVDEILRRRLESYLQAGGKLLLTGRSGLAKDGGKMALDIGAAWEGTSPFEPDYIQAAPEVCPGFARTPFVAYLGSQRIRAGRGKSLGAVFDPYFNRTYAHFCSHQHAAPREEPSGFDCGVRHGAIVYLAHPIFTAYRAYGQVALRHYAGRCLDLLLGDSRLVETNLPSTGRVTLTRQEEEKRWIVHLLYAATVSRGGALTLSGGNAQTGGKTLEVIEELTPLHGITVGVRLPEEISRVSLEPEGREIPFLARDGRIHVTLSEFACHQMIVFHQK